MDKTGMYAWMKLVWKRCPRRRLLIMDQFSAHKDAGVVSRLEGEYNTKVVFLPSNTSYLMQPLDGGPNRSFKAFMRKALRRRLVGIEDKSVAPTDADMCVIAVQGVASISPECIRKSFSRLVGIDDDVPLEDEDDFHELQNLPNFTSVSVIQQENGDFHQFMRCLLFLRYSQF